MISINCFKSPYMKNRFRFLLNAFPQKMSFLKSLALIRIIHHHKTHDAVDNRLQSEGKTHEK